MDKPFEFDLNEEVVVLVPQARGFWRQGPFRIHERKHGSEASEDVGYMALWDFAPNHLLDSVKTVDRYKLFDIKGGCVSAGWYRESDLTRSVLHQLMRARRSSCG